MRPAARITKYAQQDLSFPRAVIAYHPQASLVAPKSILCPVFLHPSRFDNQPLSRPFLIDI